MSRTCATCGFKSEVEAFFRRESGGLLGLRETVCEGCSPYRPSSYERRLAIRLAFAQLWWAFPTYLIFGYGLKEGLLFLTMIGASLVSMPLRILVHEAGHAFAAKAVGREVFEVSVGRGPNVLTWRLWGARVEIRRYAFAGGLMRYFDLGDQPSRLRAAAIIVAGPGANAVCAGVLFGASFLLSKAPTPIAQVGMAALAGVGVSQVATALFNLIPRRFGDDQSVPSDGMQLLRLFGGRAPIDADARTLSKVYGLSKCDRHEEAAAMALDAAANSEYALLFLSLALHNVSRSRGDRAAVDLYLQRADDVALRPSRGAELAVSQLPWLQANVAWIAIKAGTGALKEIIEPFSLAALQAVPDAPEVRGTRGAWLVASGQFDEGVALLTSATRTVADRVDKADFCTFLASGWRALGHESRARGFEQLHDHLLAMD